ncbi:MAG: hypothetical protein WBE76_02720 [Terracidiphilus sp.]
MSKSSYVDTTVAPQLSNGSGAAAILSAGIGTFVLAVLAIASDKSAYIKKNLNFYAPTGPLSGVTTVAILVWIVIWSFLEWRWRRRTVSMAHIGATAFVLLGLSLLLTFPPFADIF